MNALAASVYCTCTAGCTPQAAVCGQAHILPPGIPDEPDGGRRLCPQRCHIAAALSDQLWQVQVGAMPSDFKPMPTVGAGAYEVRIKVQGQWRVVYVAKHDDAVYVLHCFHKTTPKTAKADIDVAGKRYKLIGA